MKRSARLGRTELRLSQFVDRAKCDQRTPPCAALGRGCEENADELLPRLRAFDPGALITSAKSLLGYSDDAWSAGFEQCCSCFVECWRPSLRSWLRGIAAASTKAEKCFSEIVFHNCSSVRPTLSRVRFVSVEV